MRSHRACTRTRPPAGPGEGAKGAKRGQTGVSDRGAMRGQAGGIRSGGGVTGRLYLPMKVCNPTASHLTFLGALIISYIVKSRPHLRGALVEVVEAVAPGRAVLALLVLN
eukprot:8126675-Pyramimonas_sp.AAC.1